MKVLLVSHHQELCGIYQYGKRLGRVLGQGNQYEFKYLETNSAEPFLNVLSEYDPDFIIYNWHVSTLSWLTPSITYSINKKQLIFHHENDLPYHLNADGYIMANMQEAPLARMYGLPRIIFDFPLLNVEQNLIPTIGSFGFGFENKGFDNLCRRVSDEFDEAILNLHITSAFFGDRHGEMARSISDRCMAAVSNPKIKLNITNNFIPDEEIVKFLNRNDINIFLYNFEEGRGLSSAVDYAVSAEKPFGITSSSMFKHVLSEFPELNLDNHSIKDVIAYGNKPSLHFKDAWSAQRVINKFYKILEELS